MTPQDRQKIVKLLNLTTSSNDAEALLAIRKANEMLGKEGMIWSDYLEPYSNTGQRGEPWRPKPRPEPARRNETAWDSIKKERVGLMEYERIRLMFIVLENRRLFFKDVDKAIFDRLNREWLLGRMTLEDLEILNGFYKVHAGGW